MPSRLPPYISHELELYLKEDEKEFQDRIKQILGNSKKEKEIRKKLYTYLKSIKKKKLDNVEENLLLTTCLLCYWSKEYELIIELFDYFSNIQETKNYSIIICYLLTLRDMFLFDKYQDFFPVAKKLVEELPKSKEQDFLFLSLEEFSSISDKRPEIGFKALNELLRYLIDLEDLASKFPFTLDVLLCDLVKFAYSLADETLKDLWIESAIKRAEQYENYGMLCSLYDLLANISIKEYNIEQTNENIEKGLTLATKIGSSRLESILKLNVASKEKMSGDLEKALEIYGEILKTDNLNLPIKIQTLGKIGDLSLLTENLDKADEYYTEAHELNKRIGFVFPLIELTYGYIRYLLGNDSGEALEFGYKLAEDQFDFNAMSYYYFYQGLYNQKKVNLSAAVNFFEKSLEFFENQLILEGIVYSQGALAESYFEMYRITENNEFGEKFLYYIDNLLNISSELQHPLFVDAIITKASYYQYRSMESKVIDSLKQGLEYAEKYKLEDRIDEINVRMRDKTSLIQELKGAKKLSHKIMTFSFGTHKKMPILLYLLLVMDEAGLPLYSYSFSEDEGMDDLLVSGLISAIITFSSEVLGKGVETLRSINHEGKAVIIEQQGNIMAVLVADNETFESRLQVRKFLKEALESISKRIKTKKVDEEELRPLVETIFETSPFKFEER